MDHSAIEQAYAFFHQKEKVYRYSTSEAEKDHIEDAISSYVNQMSPELYMDLSGGSNSFLREHSSFAKDINEALKLLEELMAMSTLKMKGTTSSHQIGQRSIFTNSTSNISVDQAGMLSILAEP